MKCPIGLDKIHCQNCYFMKDGKCRHKKMMGKKAQQGFSTIVLMLWGMGYIAVGFILLPFVGVFWALTYFVLVGLGGLYIGLRMLKPPDKNQGNDEEDCN